MSQITNHFLAPMPSLTIKGNNTVSTGQPLNLTVAQVNAILPIFTSTLNGLVPFSGGGATNFLRADGSWSIPAGTGTVTSVALTVPSFLSVAGSPVTSSGTLAVTLSGTALPITSGGTGQITAGPAFNALSPITSTGDLIIGIGTNSASRLAIGTNNQLLTSNGTTASWITPAFGTVTSVAATVPAFLSVAGSPITTSGTLAISFSGSALPIANGGTAATTKSGAFDSLSPMTTGGDLIYGGTSGTGTRLANGSAGQVLTSAGTTLAPTWSNASTGTVTSVALSLPSFITVSGSPVTTSGTLTGTLATQAAGTFFAGPTSGAAAAPTFRALQAPTIQQFTAGTSGTYTLPAGALYIVVKMVGAGAGGSGAGTAGAGNGTAGGNTTFGSSFLTANGGGTATFTGTSTGGTATIVGLTGIAIKGGDNSEPMTSVLISSAVSGGRDGSVSPFGGAGAGGTPGGGGATVGGNASSNCGSGGGGGGCTNSSANNIGGTGGSAGGYIEVMIPSPSSTYAYSVGSGGSGGAAGSNGDAGGSGSGGRIYIQEFYQ